MSKLCGNDNFNYPQILLNARSSVLRSTVHHKPSCSIRKAHSYTDTITNNCLP